MSDSRKKNAAKKSKDESVRVIVRCRPLNSTETANGNKSVVDVRTKDGIIQVQRDGKERPFTFDATYGPDAKQIDIYNETVRPLVDSVLEGYNGTVFAYGQTGTGKTHTMQGPSTGDPDARGIIPNTFHHVFTEIARSDGEHTQFLVRASYLEIYLDEIRDLLQPDQKKRLELREKDTGIYVNDLSSFVVKNVKEIEKVMNVGNKNRKTGATAMNDQSSRSHACFIITIERSDERDGEQHIRAGKLNLVDLAGSERQVKTGAEGNRLKEATKINTSLSALGNVISALTDAKATFVPYRDSKLTRLLQDSLGGNAKTVMIANVGPADYNYDETLNTLRYANRAKSIKNAPRINEDPKDALLRQFQDEIEKLKRELMQREGGEEGGGGGKKKKERKTKRRKKRGGEEEEGEEGEPGEGEDDVDGALKAEQAALEAEREALLKDKTMIEKDKRRIAAELDVRQEELQREMEERNVALSKLRSMESKLLIGGVTIQDHTTAQERALEAKQRELEEQARRERELQQQLVVQQEQTLHMNEQTGSLQERVDTTTRKLKKLVNKLVAAKQEIEDLQEDFRRKREELLEITDDLTRDLKLKTLIVDNFVPRDDAARTEKLAVYDDASDAWVFQTDTETGRVAHAGVRRPISACGNRRPVCEHARVAIAMGDTSTRYRPDNIVELALEMPQRTTMDYEGPSVAPGVQAALDSAFREDEEDVTVVASTKRDIFAATDRYLDDDDDSDNDQSRNKRSRRKRR